MIKTKNTYDGRNSNQHMHHLLDVFAAVFWTVSYRHIEEASQQDSLYESC